MAPCNVSWNCDGVTGSTVLSSGQTVTVCSNAIPTTSNCNGQVIIVNEGLCVNGQCDYECQCYIVTNPSQLAVSFYYRDCTNPSSLSQMVLSPLQSFEICSTSIPNDPTQVLNVVRLGACINGECVTPPAVDYYAIRMNNIFEYMLDGQAVDDHLAYVLCQGFKVVQLYGLYTIFNNLGTYSAALKTYLQKCYALGLKPVAILGSDCWYIGRQIYIDVRNWEIANNIQFWGVNKECFFWNCGSTCDQENEEFRCWIATMDWLRAGYGTFHFWHISCFLSYNPIQVPYGNPLPGETFPWGAYQANRIVGSRPDVIEIDNTSIGAPDPTVTPFSTILPLIQQACVSLGITNQQIATYWNAEAGFSGPYFDDYATHGPEWVTYSNNYNSTIAPSYPNLVMNGLTMFTYDTISLAQPACIPGYTTTTTIPPTGTTTTTTVPSPGTLPQVDKIFVLWFTNRAYNSIVGRSAAPYINSIIQQGTLFTNMWAQSTQSQPNYLAVYAGDTFGVTNNLQWGGWNSQNYQTLYNALNTAGKTFGCYLEDIPSTGAAWPPFTSGAYVGYHDPAGNFSTNPQNIRKPWTPSSTEDVIFLIPSQTHNMDLTSIQAVDNWMQGDSVVQNAINWCTNNNGLFVIYWDAINGGDPRIPVTFYGPNVGVLANNQSNWGFYQGHYSFLRTIIQLMGGTPNIGNSGSVPTLVGWY